MKADVVKMVQQCLIGEGFAPGTVDGKLGTTTYAAVIEALLQRASVIPEEWQRWSDARKTVAYLQCLCKENSIDVGDIDGLWGPQTDFAVDTLSQFIKRGEMPAPWRDDSPLVCNPHNWPTQDEKSLNTFFGNVGTHQSSLVLPYPHRVSWDMRRTITSFSCNTRVHDSARRALTRVFDHYGMERIRSLRLDRWGGCLNVRRMRGGSNWSMHSWGIAIDYDPERNQLKWGRSQAAFAQPEYDAWWRFWEEEGWVSLGRTKNYDWMHLQAARV